MGDPKNTILSVVDGIWITRDDDVTNARILFLYAEGPETLRELFDDYDVVVAIEDSRTRPTRHTQDVPTYYPSIFPIRVMTVDKYNAAGALICTATKMQWKMKDAMRTIIAANAQVGAYTLRIMEESANDRWLVGFQLFESIYTIEHKEA